MATKLPGNRETATTLPAPSSDPTLPAPSSDPTLPAPSSDPTLPAPSSDPTANSATLPGSIPPAASSPNDIPSLVTVDRSNYVIDRAFARGGMGRISAARDRRLGRTVAIKELLAHDESLARRFEREARITARLQHPGIVPLHEAGRWPSGEPFYAMKLVTGRSLDQVVDATPTLAARLALLPNVIAVVDALAYAHGERVIHRDLKPSNVLLGAFGETVVIDWGLAKELDATEPESFGPYRKAAPEGETVGVLGTPAYMPPEQAAGERLDTRADVYSLGALLYHVLAGSPPYRGASIDELLDQVLAAPPVPLGARVPDAPAELVAIVERAMARDPKARFPTANEMADELKRFQTGKLVESHRYSLGEIIRRWIRRHRGIAITVAAALVIVVAGASVFLWRERALRGQAETARQTAERALAWTLSERGREELIAHHPGRAAALLAAAYPARPDDRIVRMLLARALRDTERVTLAISHREPVTSAAFSPDGAQVLTTSSDGIARLWDARTGTLAVAFGAGANSIRTAALSGDGRRVVTTPPAGNTATIWDAHTAAVVVTLEGHTGAPVLAKFNADGTRVITASADETARLWDARTGAVLATFAGHDDGVLSVDLDASGTHVVTASVDHTAKIFDATTGALEATLAGHSKELVSATFTPDGKRVVTASWDGTAKIWDARTAAVVATLAGHTGQIWMCAIRADGAYIATASVDGTAKIWDARTGAIVATLVGHSGPVRAVAFGPNGRVVTASFDGTAMIWEVESGRLVAILDGNSDQVVSATFGSDGTSVLTGGDRTIRIWDARDRTSVVIGRRNDWVQGVSFSENGEQVAAAGFDKTLTIWNSRTAALLATLDGQHGSVNSVSFGAGGQIISASSDGTATLWDARTRLPLTTFGGTHRAALNSASLSADQAWFATASDDHTALVWNAHTATVAVALVGHTDHVLSVAFDPSATRAVTASFDSTARVWNARTGQELHTLQHGGGVRSAVFSPDGNRILTAGGDGTAKLWDARSGAHIATFDGHESVVQAAVFSKDALLVATAGGDATVRIWDARTAELVTTLAGHTGAVRSVAFGPEPFQLASGGTDGTVRIWDLGFERRSPAEVARVVAQKSAWQVVDGALIPR